MLSLSKQALSEFGTCLYSFPTLQPPFPVSVFIRESWYFQMRRRTWGGEKKKREILIRGRSIIWGYSWACGWSYGAHDLRAKSWVQSLTFHDPWGRLFRSANLLTPNSYAYTPAPPRVTLRGPFNSTSIPVFFTTRSSVSNLLFCESCYLWLSSGFWVGGRAVTMGWF